MQNEPISAPRHRMGILWCWSRVCKFSQLAWFALNTLPNTRPIWFLGSATVKWFNTHSAFSLANMTQKRILSANKFPWERILIFGLCLLDKHKKVSHIDSLLKVNFRSLATHFGFGFPYELVVGNRLSTISIIYGYNIRYHMLTKLDRNGKPSLAIPILIISILRLCLVEEMKFFGYYSTFVFIW